MMEVAARRGLKLNTERRFFLAMAGMILAAVLVGFARTWFLRFWMYQPAMLPLTPLVWLHGVLFTSWILTFMTQVALVSAGRTDIHRRLGITGLGFAVAMAVVGTLAGLYGVARASGPPGIPPLSFLAEPLIGVVAFSGFMIAGLAKRRDPATHKRLMLLAMIMFLPPAFGRMPIFPGPVGIIVIPGLFILALVGWDLKSRGRIHPATRWGGLAGFIALILPISIWNTEAWLGFARWATRLVAG